MQGEKHACTADDVPESLKEEGTADEAERE
jgi:hypothetical protein